MMQEDNKQYKSLKISVTFGETIEKKQLSWLSLVSLCLFFHLTNANYSHHEINVTDNL